MEKVKDEKRLNEAVEIVYKGLLDGYDADTICRANGFKGNFKTSVIKQAKARFNAYLENTADEDKAQILAMYMDLYQRSKGIGNLKLCANILDSVSEIKNVKQNTVVLKQEFDVDWQ